MLWDVPQALILCGLMAVFSVAGCQQHAESDYLREGL